MIRTLAAAAGWIDETGLALIFPKADVVLPSLWEQVNGSAERNWAVRDPEGGFVTWTEEMGFLWGAKDELPAQGLACVGKHLARVSACIAPRLVPTLVAANGDAADDEPVVEAIREHGPADRAAAPRGDRAHEEGGRPRGRLAAPPAGAHELASRRAGRPLGCARARADGAKVAGARRPAVRGRTRGASWPELVLDQAGELTAADLGGALAWRRKEAAAILDEIADGRDDEAGFRIWTRR